MERKTVKIGFWVLFLLFVPTLVALIWLDLPLRNAVAPYGIVSYELCGLQSNCMVIVESWQGPQLLGLMILQGLDYLFLLLYAGLIACAMLLLAGMGGRFWHITTRLVWLAAVMALADAVENYALIRIVLDGNVGVYGAVASTAALIKFTLLALLLGWLLVLLVRRLWQRSGSG